MRSLDIADEAKRDIRDIYQFAADRDQARASRLLSEINTVLERLCVVPGVGHLRRDLIDADYRFTNVGPYLVVYRYSATAISVARVVHGSRNLSVILGYL